MYSNSTPAFNNCNSSLPLIYPKFPYNQVTNGYQFQHPCHYPPNLALNPSKFIETNDDLNPNTPVKMYAVKDAQVISYPKETLIPLYKVDELVKLKDTNLSNINNVLGKIDIDRKLMFNQLDEKKQLHQRNEKKINIMKAVIKWVNFFRTVRKFTKSVVYIKYNREYFIDKTRRDIKKLTKFIMPMLKNIENFSSEYFNYAMVFSTNDFERKKNSIFIVKSFIHQLFNDLTVGLSNINNYPEGIVDIFKRYIEDGSRYPMGFFSTFEFNRLEFSVALRLTKMNNERKGMMICFILFYRILLCEIFRDPFYYFPRLQKIEPEKDKVERKYKEKSEEIHNKYKMEELEKIKNKNKKINTEQDVNYDPFADTKDKVQPLITEKSDRDSFILIKAFDQQEDLFSMNDEESNQIQDVNENESGEQLNFKDDTNKYDKYNKGIRLRILKEEQIKTTKINQKSKYYYVVPPACPPPHPTSENKKLKDENEDKEEDKDDQKPKEDKEEKEIKEDKEDKSDQDPKDVKEDKDDKGDPIPKEGNELKEIKEEKEEEKESSKKKDNIINSPVNNMINEDQLQVKENTNSEKEKLDKEYEDKLSSKIKQRIFIDSESNDYCSSFDSRNKDEINKSKINPNSISPIVNDIISEDSNINDKFQSYSKNKEPYQFKLKALKFSNKTKNRESKIEVKDFLDKSKSKLDLSKRNSKLKERKSSGKSKSSKKDKNNVKNLKKLYKKYCTDTEEQKKNKKLIEQEIQTEKIKILTLEKMLVKEKILHNFRFITNILSYIFENSVKENVTIYREYYKENFCYRKMVAMKENGHYPFLDKDIDENELYKGVVFDKSKSDEFINENFRWLEMYKSIAIQLCIDMAKKISSN